MKSKRKKKFNIENDLLSDRFSDTHPQKKKQFWGLKIVDRVALWQKKTIKTNIIDVNLLPTYPQITHPRNFTQAI